MSRRPATIPTDTWPPRMNAGLAAGYCGEKHVEDFLERVGSVYPQPRWTESTKRKFWYRPELDRALGMGEVPTGMGARFGEKIRQKRDG